MTSRRSDLLGGELVEDLVCFGEFALVVPPFEEGCAELVDLPSNEVVGDVSRRHFPGLCLAGHRTHMHVENVNLSEA